MRVPSHPRSSRARLALAASCAFSASALVSLEASARDDLVEAAVVGGYRWLGSADIEEPGQNGSLKADSAPAWGGTVGFRTQPDGLVVLWYSRQETSLEIRPSGATGPYATRNVTFEYFHFGGVIEGEYGPSIPYIGMSVGLTRLGAADVGPEWRFSTALELGFKLPVTSFLHLRLLGRAPVTFMTGSTEVYCITPAGCNVSLTAKPIAQVELLGGLGVNF